MAIAKIWDKLNNKVEFNRNQCLILALLCIKEDLWLSF